MDIEKKRLLWLDYAKVIGIYFVILGHIALQNTQIGIWIFSFHMPLFFILSGFLEKGTDSVTDTIRKGFRTLIVPYIVFYLTTYIWWLCVTYQRNPLLYERSVTDAFIRPIVGLFLGEAHITPLAIMISVPLWFLIGLFFCRILFRIGVHLCKNQKLALLLSNLLAIILIYIVHKAKINIYFSLDSAIMAIPFYSFGFLLQDIIPKIKDNFLLTIFIALSCLIIGWLLAMWNGRVDINDVIYGKNLLVFYINGIIGSLAVIYFTRLFHAYKNHFLLYLGANTIIILAYHIILTALVKNAYNFISPIKFSSTNVFSTTEGVIISLVVLFLSAIPIYIITRYFPFMLGKQKRQN